MKSFFCLRVFEMVWYERLWTCVHKGGSEKGEWKCKEFFVCEREEKS